MSEQHTGHQALQSRRQQTGELVSMLVEEPLPSHVKPSGRLDFLLRAHPPLIQPSLAQQSSAQQLSGVFDARLNTGAANTAAKNTLTLRADTHRKLPVPTGTTKDPELVRTTMPS